MEGAGAYEATERARDTEIILIKAICDWADGSKNDRAQPYAAYTAVSLAHYVLSQPDVLSALGVQDVPENQRESVELPKQLDNSPSSLKQEQQSQIFLAHASEDKDKVLKLYNRLKQEGYKPSNDIEDNLGGLPWNKESPKAIEKSDFVIICLSKTSIEKEVYLQREFGLTLNKSAKKTPLLIFLILLEIDDFEVPDLHLPDVGLNLRDIQRVNYHCESEGFKELVKKILDNTKIKQVNKRIRDRCYNKIQKLYSKIQLFNLKEIDVDQLYVDIYILNKPSYASFATIPDLLKDFDLRENFDRFGLGERGKRSPGLKAAKLYKKLMILGKPGSGKSTFLRHIAIACCKGEFQPGYIPILIELRNIDASNFNLVNEIHKQFYLDDKEQTKQLLKQGQILILLDGLDEVASPFRQTVQKDISRFCEDYYENSFIRLIITCRTQTTEYRLPNFEYIEVADFNSKQIECFANNWFSTIKETAEEKAKLTTQFIEKLKSPENKQIAELAVTPILLSLTCWVFSDLKEFPSKRSKLYQKGINLLLAKWDESRGIIRDSGSEIYREMSATERQKLLSYIAFRKFEQQQYALFEESEIQEYIAEYPSIPTEDAKKLPKTIEEQHGLLVERAQDIYSFSHLTFQEFLTAQYISDQPLLEKELVKKHLIDSRWREVFLLLAELQ